MAQIFYTDGREEQVTPKNGKTFSLEELQGIVGGYIEVLDLGDNYMVVDEEGNLKGYDFNAKATALYGMRNNSIVGDALVCSKSMIE